MTETRNGTGIVSESKEVRIARRRIATKTTELKGISYVGPFVLIVLAIIVGFLGLILMGLLGFLLGIILLGVGIWWDRSRDNERRKLQNEIAELEEELA